MPKPNSLWKDDSASVLMPGVSEPNQTAIGFVLIMPVLGAGDLAGAQWAHAFSPSVLGGRIDGKVEHDQRRVAVAVGRLAKVGGDAATGEAPGNGRSDRGEIPHTEAHSLRRSPRLPHLLRHVEDPCLELGPHGTKQVNEEVVALDAELQLHLWPQDQSLIRPELLVDERPPIPKCYHKGEDHGDKGDPCRKHPRGDEGLGKYHAEGQRDQRDQPCSQLAFGRHFENIVWFNHEHYGDDKGEAAERGPQRIDEHPSDVDTSGDQQLPHHLVDLRVRGLVLLGGAPAQPSAQKLEAKRMPKAAASANAAKKPQ
mmetsp:Transcript_114474/g.224588  ORF Transcript_114474/g.224588 Transcript_114474/m.224588 type:complete len:312 (-) Transcript_114474:73-1008(-)